MWGKGPGGSLHTQSHQVSIAIVIVRAWLSESVAREMQGRESREEGEAWPRGPGLGPWDARLTLLVTFCTDRIRQGLCAAARHLANLPSPLKAKLPSGQQAV